MVQYLYFRVLKFPLNSVWMTLPHIRCLNHYTCGVHRWQGSPNCCGSEEKDRLKKWGGPQCRHSFPIAQQTLSSGCLVYSTLLAWLFERLSSFREDWNFPFLEFVTFFSNFHMCLYFFHSLIRRHFPGMGSATAPAAQGASMIDALTPEVSHTQLIVILLWGDTQVNWSFSLGGLGRGPQQSWMLLGLLLNLHRYFWYLLILR